jgi:hypothetical protein
MANGNQNSALDTGTKIVIGLASVAVLFALLNGDTDDDAWEGDDTATVKESGTGADAVDLDDDEVEAPVDDPWTRGAPPEDGDDEPELPADDPWTRGSPADDGDDDDGGLPACVATMEYRTEDGWVRLPIDRFDDEWASADCTFSRGQSGEPVELVQVALNVCNGQRIPADGVNGDATRRALANVQSAHGIRVDGGYGPATREVMAWPTAPEDGGPGLCAPRPDVG